MTDSGKRDRAYSRAGATRTSSRPQPPSPTLDRVIQAKIGDKLRAMYGELADQPVPDRLTSILSRLGTAGREGGS